MKKEQIKKILEELEARKIATIGYSDGSKIIVIKNKYNIDIYVKDIFKTFVRTFKNIKELEKYLTNINIY